jgi:hypothetical protein
MRLELTIVSERAGRKKDNERPVHPHDKVSLPTCKMLTHKKTVH